MKKLILTGSALFLLLGILHAHPLHISVVNISINGSDLKIRINTFKDDWETAYYHYHGKMTDLEKQQDNNQEWFREALGDCFQVRENKDSDDVSLVLDSISFEDTSMTIEMHAKLRKAPKTLYIYNSILTDIFPDQTNLVIISLGNKETGMKFDHKKRQGELKLR